MTFPAELWGAMALFVFVTSVTPGPNNMMLLASGVNFGVRRTLPHMVGISCGYAVMSVCVGLGLGELFTRVPAVYTVMKVVGMAYMLYLAWGMLRSSPPTVASTSAANTAATPESAAHSQAQPLGFWGAAAFQWVNPKAWVMVLGFFSNYMPAQAGLAWVLAASLMSGVINLPCVGSWAVLGARLRHYLAVPRYHRIFNTTMALLLVASMAVSLFKS